MSGQLREHMIENADLSVRLINARIDRGLRDNSKRGVDHLRAAGLHLRGVRAGITRAQWPGWLAAHIEYPRVVIDRALGLIEKKGEEKYAPAVMMQPRPRPVQLPLRLMHRADPVRLRTVIRDMRRSGRPEITCVFTDGALYALEGVHRLHAASQSFLSYSVRLNCLAPDAVLTFEDRLRLFADHYRCDGPGDMSAAEVVASLDCAWDTELATRRDRVPCPGVYDRIMVFGGPSPWSLGFRKSSHDKELVTPTAAERIRANWQYDDYGRWRSQAGSRFIVTVFPVAGGWKIWLGDKVKGNVSGEMLFATAEAAKARAVWAVDQLETKQ
jgi:hypothetical protein